MNKILVFTLYLTIFIALFGLIKISLLGNVRNVPKMSSNDSNSLEISTSKEVLNTTINSDNNANVSKITKEFIEVNGTQFKKNDKSYYIIGANYWQAMNLGASESGNRSRVLTDLKILKENGINCVRIMAGSEGPEGEPYRMYPALMNSPGDYNENVFQGMKL